jgi:two-component system OmpR family response regulator
VTDLDAAVTGSPPGDPVRVLVVDDESNITDLVATALRYEGFEVADAADGRSALTLVSTFRPDLIVLDVMLPDLDGFEVQRRLTDDGRRTPVVFLTARDATEDKVKGLTIGGDDYVTKPFSLEELIARIRTVLRRARGAAPSGDRLRFHDLEMDEDSHEVRRAGRVVDLTATEFSLLRLRSSTTYGSTTSVGTPPSSRPTSAICARRSTPRNRT